MAPKHALCLILLLVWWAVDGTPARGAQPAPKIHPANIATWPAPPEGLVKSFSVKASQGFIGFTLGTARPSARSAGWHWRSKGFQGQIQVATWRTPADARSALSSVVLWGTSAPLGMLRPDGAMIADVAWGRTTGADVFCWACRRNVFFTIRVDGEKPGAADELIRLAERIVQAIDSAELVRDPKLVAVPAIQVQIPEKGKAGTQATVRIVGPPGGAASVECACFATPEQLAQVVATDKSPPKGEIRHTVDLKKAGRVKIVVFAADQSGMATKAEGTLLIE